MSRLALLAVAGLAALALGGCLAGWGAGVEAWPVLPLQPVAPGGLTEFALALRAEEDTEVPVLVVDAPDEWQVLVERPTARLSPDGTLVLVAVSPPEGAAHGLRYVSLKVGPRDVFLAALVRDLSGEPARPGVGALVRTVGVWDNGTVFYTNMKEVRDNGGLRFGDLGGGPPSEEDYDPLKVYVGGTRGVPPPEPYNTSGYRPVIAGFDARLRGMREGEVRGVRIAPEQAYTLPGNEEHPLYGDALTFLIEVARVDDLASATPCGLPVCPPPMNAEGGIDADSRSGEPAEG